jgi:DNA polymerase V
MVCDKAKLSRDCNTGELIMPRGGAGRNAGRKPKWGEKIVNIGVPSSIGNDLIRILEILWDKGLRGTDLIVALESVEFNKVRKYDYPVSAGAHSTSTVGGDSMNTNYEDIDLRATLIGDANDTIIIPVIGDSMIGIGIHPGDWLIVKQINPLYEQPEEGNIVIVSVDDETLVKRFTRQNNEVVLVSENEAHKPIRPSEGSIYVSGIVKSAIRHNL